MDFRRRFARSLPALGAALLLTGGLAGCADRAEPVRTVEGPEDREVYLTGYPFRPAPFYNLDHMDELSGPAGYTGGY